MAKFYRHTVTEGCFEGCLGRCHPGMKNMMSREKLERRFKKQSNDFSCVKQREGSRQSNRQLC